MMNSIRQLVDDYIQYWDICPEELSLLSAQLHCGEDVTDRNNWNGHVTASALVLDAAKEEVLLIQSKKFDKLLLPGGHLDRGEAPAEAARRELYEETGLSAFENMKIGSSRPVPIEINNHWIAENKSRNEPKHRHYDFIYPFWSRGARGGLNPDPNEAVSVRWYKLTELNESYTLSLERLLQILEN